jgi:hypothetical protein
VLNGGALSTLFIPDTEEVTGSIPVSPTSTKRASEQRKRDSEFLCIRFCSGLSLVECCPNTGGAFVDVRACVGGLDM